MKHTEGRSVQPNGWSTLEQIVDDLNPELNAYEATLYLYLLRHSIVKNGDARIRIGKRTIASTWVKAARGGGKGNAGGIRPNYQHVSETLKGLEEKGCLEIGDTNREGTLYTIREPAEIPVVARKRAAMAPEPEDEDYFHGQAKRESVFLRDGWRCQYCGEVVTELNVTLDHFVPQSQWKSALPGVHGKANLRTACLSCNSIKSGKTYEEAAPLLLKAIAARRSKTA